MPSKTPPHSSQNSTPAHHKHTNITGNSPPTPVDKTDKSHFPQSRLWLRLRLLVKCLTLWFPSVNGKHSTKSAVINNPAHSSQTSLNSGLTSQESLPLPLSPHRRPPYFATEGASVLGVLAYFNLLHHFPEGGTITGPVFTHDSDLLGAFSLLGAEKPAILRTGNGAFAPHSPPQTPFLQLPSPCQ